MAKQRFALSIRMAFGAAMLFASTAAHAGSADPADPVKVESVEVALTVAGPVVLLKAQARAIPVFVDPTVAESIHAALTRRALPRPLSHDLMRTILQAYGGKVTQVEVSLKGATYYGALSVDLGGSSKVFDSRSSDAIALAIHFSAPILVSRELLEQAGTPLDAPPGQLRL
jgi:bifunctional DNase/RNase